MVDLKLVISSRCFFPLGAWGYSTKRIAELAESVGYEGVEFLPSHRFVYEMWRYGKLLAPKSMVVSGHRDWRFDRVMEARLKGKPWWWYQFKEKADWLFPPSSVCLKALKRFQDVYNVPISSMWFKDRNQFDWVMLELWSDEMGVNQKDLVSWLKEDPKHRGVVVDTAKFTSWCETNKVSKDQVWSELEPYIWEIHYRVKGKYDRHMDLKGFIAEDTIDNLEWILKDKRWRGPDSAEAISRLGRIVVEFGYPDLIDNPFSLVSADLAKFRKLHSEVIGLIEDFLA